MNEKEILKSLRINHVFSLFAVALVVVAFETGLLGEGTLASVIPADGMYILEVATVMSTIALVPFALIGFSKGLTKSMGLSDEDFLKLFAKKSMQRIFVLFVTLLLNTFVYYGIPYEGSLYCGLLTLCVLIYSFPTRMVLNEYREKNNGAINKK